MPPAPQPPLLELEAALAADHDHDQRDQVLEQLVVEARAVKARLDRGLPPPDAAAAQRLLQALHGAHQVVRAVWRYHHAS